MKKTKLAVILTFLLTFLSYEFADSNPVVEIHTSALTGGLYAPIKNTIQASVSDQDGDLIQESVLILIKAPAYSSEPRVLSYMLCEGTRSHLGCSYDVYVDTNWGTEAYIYVVAGDSLSNFGEAEKTVDVLYAIIEPTPTITLPKPTPTFPRITPTISPTPTYTQTPYPSPTPSPLKSPTPTSTKTPSGYVPSQNSPTPSPTPTMSTPVGSPGVFNATPTPTKTTAPSTQTPFVTKTPVTQSPKASPKQTTAPLNIVQIQFEYPKDGQKIFGKLENIEVRITKNGTPVEYDTLRAEILVDNEKKEGKLIRIRENLFRFDLKETIDGNEEEKAITLKITEKGLEGEASIKVYFSEPQAPNILVWFIVLILIVLLALIWYFAPKMSKIVHKEARKPEQQQGKQEISESLSHKEEVVVKEGPRSQEIIIEEVHKEQKMPETEKKKIDTNIKIEEL
ncbi:MAG: hypothetical protein QXM75_03945 [Candidatus Diapherotrites archaeon]